MNTKLSDKQIYFDLSTKTLSDREIYKIFKKYSNTKNFLTKSQLLISYKKNKNEINLRKEKEKILLHNLTRKKIRSMSGVTPVTVLTKPFPCPGQCIFCPNDVKMPKSYITSEPGAQRALANKFHPYYQTFNRLTAFKNTGHPTDKIELLILGGTWSSYPKSYQIWFVKECFRALNEFNDLYDSKMKTPQTEMPFYKDKLREIDGEKFDITYNKVIINAMKDLKSKKEYSDFSELYQQHKINENSKTRCIGLTIETRPDEINQDEIIHLRKLGATRVQIGIQSLNNRILKLNKRGHDVEQTEFALRLLRQAGFKVLAHYMPNLLGASVEKDKKDFIKIFSNLNIRPDELKIYPCSLIKSAELMKYYKLGKWKPYNFDELLEVSTFAITNTPRYCRLSRVIRDIPSTEIHTGNKTTNFRQIAEKEIIKNNMKIKDIRFREVRDAKALSGNVKIKITRYKTTVSNELFIEAVNSEDKIFGFLRLSIPTTKNYIEELENSTIIREIHVYGQSLEIGKTSKHASQHKGLGKKLIKMAEDITLDKGFRKISVIASIGTRNYYRKLGFELMNLYMVKRI